MPCLEDIRSVCYWTIKIRGRENWLPIASGSLAKIVERKDSSRLYVYKTETPLNSLRIGFCIGEFKCATVQDHPSVFHFTVTRKAFDWVESCLVPGKLVKEVVDMLENFLSQKMQTKLSLVFLPNIGEGLGSFRRVAVMHAGLLILDERFLLNHNVIEYRHKFHEALAEAVAFKFFGGTVQQKG
eukprot:TRINITY_DN10200_c0_g2_i1.p3 TRINITY_DN10200_c0_g2~~TRINITY_DN10200_c0_g2_i1.p3  ORF type:complete len:184 (-),score=51.54 TRINITY_DN10200_c0_g2_i1:1220-1771(-)